MTRTLSALCMVANRCAMRMTLRPSPAVSKASWTNRSLSTSNAEVGSSSNNTYHGRGKGVSNRQLPKTGNKQPLENIQSQTKANFGMSPNTHQSTINNHQHTTVELNHKLKRRMGITHRIDETVIIKRKTNHQTSTTNKAPTVPTIITGAPSIKHQGAI